MKTIFLYLLTIFLIIFFSMLLKKHHLLAMLIGLEFLVVLLVFLYYFSFYFLSLVFLAIIFLVFSVCESVLGLVLFVMFSRSYGKDYVRFLNIVHL